MDLAPSQPHRSIGPGLRILVVEDDVRIRSQIADHLRQKGYLIMEAASADEAVLLLQRDGSAIDCVFSDVQMPGSQDGVGLARWIFRHRPGLAVLLTSGNFRSEDLEPELRAVLPVLAKPYRGEAVERQMASVMATRRPGQIHHIAN
ncbi:response regulator [Sphingomonas sp. DG1-23]|uniref:response regulator n=1 Tax=Sphingomonas sp. DG1-23 TaxID=3068316 RepID=UPI0035305CF6